jgi:hypothetical protein
VASSAGPTGAAPNATPAIAGRAAEALRPRSCGAPSSFTTPTPERADQRDAQSAREYMMHVRHGQPLMHGPAGAVLRAR